MGYPVAYLSGNTTTYETGMFKRGTIGQNQAAALTGSYRWWNGIDVTSSQYLIYSDTFTTSATTAANATPAAWTTPDLTDQSLLNLINTLPERVGKLPFTYVPVALQWIQSTGRYFLTKNGYENIVTDGQVLNLDAGWYLSYSGTGTNWKDLSSNNLNGTLINGPTFSNGNIRFDYTDDYVNFSTLPSSTSYTVSCWFSANTGNWNGALFGFGSGDSPNTQDVYLFGESPSGCPSPAGGSFGYNTWNCDSWGFGNASSILKGTGFHHVVATFNNQNLTANRLWLDGVEKTLTQQIGTTQFSANLINQFKIASNGWYVGDQLWNGIITTCQVYNRILTPTEVLQNFNAQKTRFGLTADTIVTSGLTLNLDAGSVISYPTTGTSWYDTTGNNNNVTLNNGPTFSNSGTSSSIVFDGVDDYGIIPYNSAWNYNNNITLEAWVMATTNSSNYLGIFGPFSQTPAYNGFNFSVPSGSGKFAFLVGGNGGAAYYVRQNTQYTLNTWYHLVGVINNGTSRLYVNGVLQDDSTSMTVAPPVGPFMLGKFYDGVNDYYFGGRIANGKFYNRVLSQSEITQNYNALKGRYGL
jgi:hypothetical protein